MISGNCMTCGHPVISCTLGEKLSKDRLKAPNLGVQSKFIRLLELYISGSTNPRKVVFHRLKLLCV